MKRVIFKLKIRDFFSVMLFLLILGCQQEKNINNVDNISNSGEKELPEATDFRKASFRIINDGDTTSYNTYREYMFDGEHVDRFLYFSMVMANKFDYPKAHFDVFDCILKSYICDDLNRINEIDTATFSLMNNHLNLAVEAGVSEAIQTKRAIDSIGYHGKQIYKGCDKYSDDLEIATLQGDTTAYKTLYIGSTELDFQPCQFLFWALIMANKYDFALAHGHVFESLSDDSFFEEGNELDNKTGRLANRYLQKFESASPELKEYYRSTSWMDFK